MTGPVIYEVNLTVDQELASDYADWLAHHIEQMLALPGFLGADSYRISDPVPEAKAAWTVHYRLESHAALDRYLKEHARRMREDGVKHFGDRFTASRRIYQAG